MSLNYSLEGQTAIVTGGASGIGRATVELLAQADAKVFILDADQQKGQAVADNISALASFLDCDMSKIDQIDEAYRQIIDRNGHVDILVNNVGVWMPGGNILQMDEATIAKMEVINVSGPMHLTRLVMNGMIEAKQKGCVTFVSSTQAVVIDGDPTIYNIQKNTINGMVKTFAVAGGPHNIRVNGVAPGAISTEGMGAAEAVGKERILAGNHKTALGRRGSPQEVAQEIVNLCFASYTTGDIRTVDGGFSRIAMPPSLEQSGIIHPQNPDATFLKNQ